jgi:hypothetical protein
VEKMTLVCLARIAQLMHLAMACTVSLELLQIEMSLA